MTHYLFKLLFTVRLLRAIIYSLGTEYILGNVNINAVVVPLRREEKRRGREGIGERRHYNTRPMGPAFRTHSSLGVGDVRSKNGSVVPGASQLLCGPPWCVADRN